jgi:hypothetical protein
MSENVQRDGSRNCKKENPYFERREENEEMISRNCLPHHKKARIFINKNKAARLHFLSMLSRYYPMSERVQRENQWSSLHDMVSFRYDEHRPALHAERLKSVEPQFSGCRVYLLLTETSRFDFLRPFCRRQQCCHRFDLL